jgi:hypothetical protein
MANDCDQVVNHSFKHLRRSDLTNVSIGTPQDCGKSSIDFGFNNKKMYKHK